MVGEKFKSWEGEGCGNVVRTLSVSTFSKMDCKFSEARTVSRHAIQIDTMETHFPVYTHWTTLTPSVIKTAEKESQ